MWVKFDDQTPDDPEIDDLSDGAFRLWFAGICYSQRQMTDGFIPAARVARLTRTFRKSQLSELTSQPEKPDRDPLWKPACDADGFWIRNFEKWNKNAAYWQEQSVKAAERKNRWRERRGETQ